MAVVGVVGASGIVGHGVVTGLTAAGHDVVAIGRDGARLAAAGLPGSVRLVTEAGDGSLTSLLRDLDVAVIAAARRIVDDDLRSRAISAAVGAGTAIVDVEPEQSAMRAAIDLADGARAPMIVGAGLQPAMGEALTALVLDVLELPVELHTTYTFPDHGSPPLHRGASAGRRGSAAAAVGVVGLARERGRDVEELAGEVRRLAWFPRPVGPSHAAAVPSGESVLVPRWAPEVQTVRSSVAMTGWRAELLQGAANVARWEWGRRRLKRRLTRPRPQPGPGRRAAMRWGCVAEVSGGGQVARAWAYGHDPYRLTARLAVSYAEAVISSELPAGVVPPSQVIDARELLDELGRHTDTRWSVVRP